MAATTVKVEECYREREQKVNASGTMIETQIFYFVFGVDNEETALEKASATAATKKIKGMKLDSLEISERVNQTTWKVKAIYAIDEAPAVEPGEEPTIGSYQFSFETGGGTMHRNQSITTVSKAPNDAPDFHGAIEVDNEGNVNGVDVTMPVLNFTETHVMASGKVTDSYKKTVAQLTGSVNNGNFRGFSAGEVLFLGASGTKRSKDTDAPWEITFRFAASPNQTGLKVGNLSVGNKKGWDYLWVRYADKMTEDKKNVVKEPVAAYVEQVYPYGGFGSLGLGS